MVCEKTRVNGGEPRCPMQLRSAPKPDLGDLR